MQALVLNGDCEAQVATSIALLKRGFQVVTAQTVEHAMAYAGLGVIDLVVMSERVQGRLSHSVALRAEQRNPGVTTMVQTPRVDADVDELFDLLPSLYCLLGEALSPDLVAQMAVAGVAGRSRGQGRAEVEAEIEAERAVDCEAGAESEEVGAMLADIMARARASLGDEAESGHGAARRDVFAAA